MGLPLYKTNAGYYQIIRAMRTLLIPTDFNIRTLDHITGLAKSYYPEKINIVLVHMMKITDNIHDLLMLSRRSAEHQHISDDFYATCTRLKRSNPDSINNIGIEFFYGSTVAVFKNFLEANEVDEIIMLDNYNYQMLNKNSIDPALLVVRSGKKIIQASCNSAPVRPDMVSIGCNTLVEESVQL